MLFEFVRVVGVGWFSGIWSKEESKEFENIIKKGTENIDNEW